MSHSEIVRQGNGRFDDWREVVWRKTGQTMGWLQRDQLGSAVAWDVYDADRNWLRGFSHQADAVRFLRSRFRQGMRTDE